MEPDSGVEKAGVMRGDVIRAINRQPVKSVRDFEKVSSGLKKGDHVLILIDRRGNALFLSATVWRSSGYEPVGEPRYSLLIPPDMLARSVDEDPRRHNSR